MKTKMDLPEFDRLKIDVIDKSERLEEIPPIYLPKIIEEEHYFISYSHKDYKEVYKDLIGMQSLGLQIWYDRGIPGGKSWKEFAKARIASSSCVGILFYLSPNSIASEATFEELQTIANCDKPLIAIYLGTESGIDGMAERARSLGHTLTKERVEAIKSILSEERIFLPIAMNVASKYEKIRASYRLPPKLVIKDNVILRVLDPYVESISPSDIDYALSYYKGNEKATSRKTITAIDSHAFSKSNIRHLDFGLYEVKTFRRGAFFGCASLEEICFQKADAKIYLEDDCFEGCENLVSINATFYLKRAHFAFSGCHKLKRVSIAPNGAAKVGEGLFQDCTSLEEVEFTGYQGRGTWFDEIMEDAFARCASLKKVFLPSRIEVIRENAFRDCVSLASVSFDHHYSGDGDEDDNSLREIESRAFAGCTSLETFEIPRSVTELHSLCFPREDSLKTIIFEDNPHAEELLRHGGLWEVETVTEFRLYSSGKRLYSTISGVLYDKSLTKIIAVPRAYWGDLEIPEGVSELSCSLFGRHIDRLSLPATLVNLDEKKAIHENAFKEIDVARENPRYYSFNGALYEKEGKRLIYAPIDERGEIIIEEGTLSVSDSFFGNFSKLTLLFFPSSVGKIDVSCLERLTDPDFDMVSVHPDNKAYFSFDGALYDREGPSLLYCPPGKKELHVKEGTSKIVRLAFATHPKHCLLRTLYIPSSVSDIDTYSLAKASELEWIEVDEANPDFASFEGCLYDGAKKRLLVCPKARQGELILAPTTKEIEWGGFTTSSAMGKGKISRLVLPKCFTGEIVRKSFFADGLCDLAELESIVVEGNDGEEKREIKGNEEGYSSLDGVLYDASQATMIFCPPKNAGPIRLPHNLQAILTSAIPKNNAISKVFVHSRIANYKLDENQKAGPLCNLLSLEEAEIGEDVESIGNTLFHACQSLKTLINGDRKGPVLYNKRGTFLFHFAQNAEVEELSIPNTVTEIAPLAFSYSTHLRKVIVPDSVKDFSRYNFLHAHSVMEVILPSSLTTIPEFCFDDSGLTHIDLPPSVTEIREYAFSKTYLKEISLPSSLRLLGDYAFYECAYLEKVSFGENLEEIGKAAFKGTPLRELSLPKSLRIIQDDAFSDCKSLVYLEIPAGVKRIGRSAFGHCPALSNIHYLGTMEEWKKVELSETWTFYGVIAKVVHCLDGDLPLPE